MLRLSFLKGRHVPKIELTAEQILTSDGKYPERLLAAPTDVIHNIEVLALEVTELLEHYGKRPVISSGYRDAESNKKAGGSPNSAHCLGLAVDFSDPKRQFAQWCLANVGVLSCFGLYMEDPQYTNGWVHLTIRKPKSGKIIFKP